MGRNLKPSEIEGAVAVPAWLAEMQRKELFVFRLHPSKEARVMRQFRMRGLDGYLPTMPQTRVVVKRSPWNSAERRIKQRTIVPVFPGLVFVPLWVARYDGDLRFMVEGVKDLMKFGSWTARLDDYWCGRLLEIVAITNLPHSKRARFEPGESVRIMDGPFRGFSANFDRLDSKGRLSVLISIFGRLQSVTYTDEQIEPV